MDCRTRYGGCCESPWWRPRVFLPWISFEVDFDQNASKHACAKYVYIHAHTHTHSHIHTCTRLHARTHTHAHAHTHAHM